MGEYPKVYSFQDVAEAIIVHELLEKRVPLPALRPIIEGLRERYGDWPLQHTQLETVSGPDVSVSSLLVRDGERRFELGEHGWQLVEHTMVNLERVVAELHRGGWAVREMPDLRYIEVDPDVLSGRPAIRGHRVPVSLVVELAEDPDLLAEDYNVSRDEIRDAVRWWGATTNPRPVAA